MLANWVSQSIANADALTTLNLGAATSADLVTLAQRIAVGWLAVGDMLYYQIKDGSNRESGICTIASATSVTINTVFESVIAGVLTLNPTHMTLSGSAVFNVDASSANMSGAHSNAYTTSTADVPDNFSSYTNTGGIYAANGMSLVPCEIRHRRKFSNITTWVATADAAATNTRLGLYKSGPSGSPVAGTLIFDTGDVSASFATTGQKTFSVGSIVLDPGMYYMAATSSSTTLKAWGSGNTSFPGGFGGINYYNNNRRIIPKSDGVTGALPASVASAGGVFIDALVYGFLP